MLFRTAEFYSPKLLTSHPRKIFLFGDNLKRVGRGGQAAIRGCRNALGVATKAAPDMNREAFFSDDTLHLHMASVVADLETVKHRSLTSDIVVPINEHGDISLGLGLADLTRRSPSTYRVICSYLWSLAMERGGWAAAL